MSYIITRLCRDCVDTACAAVCPVSCIYRYEGDDNVTFPNQLYINPSECIDCQMCEPACPWEAIFPEDEVPIKLQDDIELNYKVEDHEEDFEIPDEEDNEPPSSEEIEANRKKWGLTR